MTDQDFIRQLKAQRDAAIRDRDHWRANHDRAVETKRAVLDRPDLAERASLVRRLQRERDLAVQRVMGVVGPPTEAERANMAYLGLRLGELRMVETIMGMRMDA